ncbi:MAG: acetate--CoA ligase family protein, partial [Burkholderiales bacterium]|nr:acetate--CoA ligase family protein [Burkholderiales bacterium]
MKELLNPASVAIIGASDDPTKTTGRPLRFLRQAQFAGRIYPVNPNRDSVQGERAWPTIESLPETPDHAYIVVPTDAVLDAVERCGKRGVRVATILANGFSEAGDAGLAREQRLRRLVAETGIRVVGPSSLGVVNVRERLLLTANAAFAEPDLPEGSIFVASQSGTMIGSILSRGKARGIGFAGLVSVGNEVDLGVGEICEATLDDPSVSGYLLFLETLRQADAIRRFALAAAERGKAIVAYKLGRSSAGADLSLSHTGALAGEDDVANAFFRDCGIARVHTLDGLIEGLPLVSRVPMRHARKPRVAVVTTTGGGAAMVVDQLGVRGIDVGPIVDLTLAGTRYDVMKAALDEQLASPDIDLVIAVPGSSARYEPELAVRPVIDSAGAAKPLAAFVVPDAPQALAMLTEAGVPNFRTPEACADAIAAAYSRRPRVGGDPGTRAERHALLRPLDSRLRGNDTTLDELKSYEVLARLGIRHAATEDPKFPVALKVLSADIPHKTEAGGVMLDIPNAEALRSAREEMRKRTGADRFLVQEMVRGVGEALIGYRVDPQVGPIVMLAAGGVLAEIHRDRSLRLAPVDLETAREMVAEVAAFRALAGYRGRAPGDLEALAAALAALSQLAR